MLKERMGLLDILAGKIMVTQFSEEQRKPREEELKEEESISGEHGAFGHCQKTKGTKTKTLAIEVTNKRENAPKIKQKKKLQEETSKKRTGRGGGVAIDYLNDIRKTTWQTGEKYVMIKKCELYKVYRLNLIKWKQKGKFNFLFFFFLGIYMK
uniref:Uncharacterized protein n=1 Tax=Micrurus spixii TaxID=129469 RepID=A0A2D4NFA9_9SAUR